MKGLQLIEEEFDGVNVDEIDFDDEILSNPKFKDIKSSIKGMWGKGKRNLQAAKYWRRDRRHEAEVFKHAYERKGEKMPIGRKKLWAMFWVGKNGEMVDVSETSDHMVGVTKKFGNVPWTSSILYHPDNDKSKKLKFKWIAGGSKSEVMRKAIAYMKKHSNKALASNPPEEEDVDLPDISGLEDIDMTDEEEITQDPGQTTLEIKEPVPPTGGTDEESVEPKPAEVNPPKRSEIFCLTCKKKVPVMNPVSSRAKNGTGILKGKCPNCGGTTVTFLKSGEGPAKNPPSPEGELESPVDNPSLQQLGKAVDKKIKAARKSIKKGKKSATKTKSRVVTTIKTAKQNLTGRVGKARLFVVTFVRGEQEHLMVVKASSVDAARTIALTAKGHAQDTGAYGTKRAQKLKAVAIYTLDDWLDHVWKRWATRQKIAYGISAESRRKTWDRLGEKSKSIARRNFLNKMAIFSQNPPMNITDIEDVIAGHDEFDDDYDGEPEDAFEDNPPTPIDQLPEDFDFEGIADDAGYNLPRARADPGGKIEPDPDQEDEIRPIDECPKCGGTIKNTGRIGHNPKSNKYKYFLQCDDCKTIFALKDEK